MRLREKRLPPLAYGLSIRQPWAALVVRGLKTIEIRSWRTRWRGRIYIHAGRLADERPEAWGHVVPELQPLAQLRGGLIGAVEVTDCITYPSSERFVDDRALHLN